jgi:Ca2+-transporting ATPase
MAFTTFVLFRVVNALNARVETGSVFNRHLLTNRWLWIALGCVLLLQVAAVQSSWLKQIFDTVPLTLAQWLVCAAVAATVLMVEELIRVAARVTADQPPRPRDVTTSPSPQL